MQTFYEELDFCQTKLGELLLRRRRPMSMPDVWVYEVRLDERFLMSSLVHESEDELAHRALALLAQPEEQGWRVLVGGLGLGYTAAAALSWRQVDSLDVVELLPEVIDWHRRDLVPLASELRGDARCQVVLGDCFAWIRGGSGGTYDAVLVDIDDSPEHLLSPDHGAFYSEQGLLDARRSLRPGGVLALWTAGEVLEEFLTHLRRFFAEVRAEAVHFRNPLHSLDDVNTIYIAREPR